MARIAATALLLLAACQGASDPEAEQRAEHEEELQSAGDDRIACAPEGGDDFAPECWFERSSVEQRQILVVHTPSGEFRRLEIVSDGRGLIAADGAEQVRSQISGDMLEVQLGGYRFLFPATIASDASQ